MPQYMAMIKEMQHMDRDALTSLQPFDWSDIIPHFQFYLNSPFCRPMCLRIDKKILAIGALIYHRDTVWLAHIITHPQHRNQGLGSQMTSGLIDQINRKKYPTIYLIATDLGYPVYKKLGFVVEGLYNHLDGKKTAISPILQNEVKAVRENETAALLLFDKHITGEDRADILQPHVQHALVFHSNNQITGTYFPTFGEGFISALNHEAGQKLMEARLQHKDEAVLPVENETGLQLLLKHDFSITKTSRRMRLGKERIWQPKRMFNRVSGQIG